MYCTAKYNKKPALFVVRSLYLTQLYSNEVNKDKNKFHLIDH